MNPALLGALKSKTMWFSALTAVFGYLQTNPQLLSLVFTPQNAGTATMIVAAAMAALRVVTTQSLTEKGSK